MIITVSFARLLTQFCLPPMTCGMLFSITKGPKVTFKLYLNSK